MEQETKDMENLGLITNLLGLAASLTVIGGSVSRIDLIGKDLNGSHLERIWRKLTFYVERGWWLFVTGALYLWWLTTLSINKDINPTPLWVISILFWLGIVSAIVLVTVPERKTEGTQSKIYIGAYICVAVLALVLSYDQARTFVNEATQSCLFKSGGNLVGAIDSNDARCVGYWLKNADEESVYQSPLHVAATKDNALVLSLLLDSGKFNPNWAASNGDTPLHAAVKNRHPDMVCRLLLQGGNMHLPNRKGITPLSLAKKMNVSALIELFENEQCQPLSSR